MKISKKYKDLILFFDSALSAMLAELEQRSSRRAIVYSLKSGGKRIRPLLCLGVGEMLSVEPSSLLPLCLALEFIHTSSLIHDDLPALDNDDYRRGRESCHRAFSEAEAIIAGDSLIALAFSCLLREQSREELSAKLRLSWVELLAQATDRLCEGQLLDIAKPPLTELGDSASLAEKLEKLSLLKTAALFEVCTVGPALLAGLNGEELERLRVFGQELGLVFQLTDDILDREEESGNEHNYARLLGLAAAQSRLKLALSRIEFSLRAFAPREQELMQLVQDIANRAA